MPNRPGIFNPIWCLIYIHTHPFNGSFSGTTEVSRYQKGKTTLDFTEARDSEWQWHQLGHMQVCTLLQTGSHASTLLLSFLQAGCPSYRPTNSIKALKARCIHIYRHIYIQTSINSCAMISVFTFTKNVTVNRRSNNEQD